MEKLKLLNMCEGKREGKHVNINELISDKQKV